MHKETQHKQEYIDADMVAYVSRIVEIKKL